MSDVSIIDYGIGNILSVQRAFERVGASVELISTSNQICEAKRIVLPGVGAFKNGMEELQKRDLIEAIKSYCKDDRPFLGICLGMQMLFDQSEEFELCDGLGIIPGVVKKISETTEEGETQKIPHIGWNEIYYMQSPNDSIMKQVPDKTKMYFVHSYTAHPIDDRNRLADAYYGGNRLAAMVKKGNVYGTQFHPEKSGSDGIKVINEFSNI